MANYHFVYKDVEGASTQWDDIQKKLGNLPPKPPAFKPPFFKPAEDEDSKHKDKARHREIRDDIEEDAFRGLCAMVSPWHDRPLHLGDGVFNFIVELPKETSAKMEVATDESYTPIKQDTKKGKLSLLSVRSPKSFYFIFLNYNINWNYGLFPQMWEDPSFANSEVEGALRDNNPVDVVEIGQTRGKIGQIMKVKPLAALKIVAISLDDPRASLVNDIDDVEKHLPGTLTAVKDWFRDYKIPDGNLTNKFGLGNKAANKDYALKIITETNESWAKLVKRSVPPG
ncbi:hypothetical protein LOK49_LG10G00738 [Camellia lanceoleosa]|uniref:Uncharacterized protein n=1 Tax=Camellia lanceoleosa TaxID=1840588 RepID=A0ACC0G6D8_9ERIC|nr:hypothetical protein LOK49_LG10G00738 [Camellia lanceoleosa]